MTDKDYQELQQLLLNNDVIGTSHIKGLFSETLELIFSNGKKIHITAFSENSDDKGILETLEIQK